MDIRQCHQEDLPLLEAGNPSPGQSRYHDRRFERQQQGTSTFLIAWADGVPVGHGEILWNGCAAPEVHQHHPDCPELNGLEVWPAARRSHGIGTAIIRAAEALTRYRGYRQIGLGVGDDNVLAASLYRRLGYQETGRRYLDRYYYLDDNGHRHDVADPARFLVKQLYGNPQSWLQRFLVSRAVQWNRLEPGPASQFSNSGIPVLTGASWRRRRRRCGTSRPA